MITLAAAQAALGAFDTKYWQHPPGHATIDHTVAHLMEAVTDCLWRNTPPTPMIRARSDALIQARQRLPGRLVEHGLRLANAAGRNLDEKLVALGHADLQAWIHSTRAEGDRYRSHLGSLAEDFLAGLAPLFQVHRRTGHGEEPDAEMLVLSALHLLAFGLILSLDYISSPKAFFEYLVEPRLRYLWEKYSTEAPARVT